jgi:hypothetical protein
MAAFVRYVLEDGTEVLFEAAGPDSDLVSPRGAEPDTADGGRLTTRLEQVTRAVQQMAATMRERMAGAEQVQMQFGVTVGGGGNWFFAKAHGEASISVTVAWAGSSGRSPGELGA